LLFVFRLFPLYDIHPHALRAAEAGEAANAQGQFWPMFEGLFKLQGRLSESTMLHCARDIGLDISQYEADMANHAQLSQVRDSIVSGERSGVGGTPTFFINGEYFHHKTGLWDPIALKRAIRSAI
jgi:protein-disulfide isomerase